MSNYQETVNTLHFGQKAKNVKTKVNVNEISLLNTSSSTNGVELEKANSLITELKDRLKFFENQMLPPSQICPAIVEEIEETKDAPMIAMKEEHTVANNDTSYAS